jgi:hypothetical protein
MLLTKRIETLLEQLPKNVLDEDWSSMLKVMKENHFMKVLDILKLNKRIHGYDYVPIRRNRSITMDYVLNNNSHLILTYGTPCDLTIDMLVKYEDFRWNWPLVTCHPNITFEDIIQNPELPWVDIICNKTTPVDYILKELDKMDPVDVDIDVWNILLKNRKISLEKYLKETGKGGGNIKTIRMEDIENIPHEWDWDMISINPNLTMEMILKHKDKNWYWNFVSMNKGITMQNIKDHIDFPWNWIYVSLNPNLTIEMIDEFPDKPWDVISIVRNRNLTPEMLLSSKTIKFNFSQISYNPNLTSDFVLQHLEESWDYEILKENPMDGEQKRMKKKLKVLEQKLIKVRDTKELLYSWKKDTIFSFLVNDILDMISCYA